MLDFRMIINGTIPGGVWVLVFLVVVSLGIITYMYLSSELMKTKTYIRSMVVSVFGSVFVYSLLLLVFPPIRLIPNVVISPVFAQGQEPGVRALPYFLSQVLRKSFPTKINTIPDESVQTVVNSHKWTHPDSLIQFARFNHIHFVVTLVENSDQSITLTLTDTRYGETNTYGSWDIPAGLTLTDQLVETGNAIVSAMYPDLTVSKSRLIEEVTRSLPSNEEELNRFMEARKLITGGEFLTAIPKLESWIKTDTGSAWNYHYLGKACLGQSRREVVDSLKRKYFLNRANYYLLEAVKKDQTSVEFLHELADYYLQLSQFADAEDVVKAAFVLDPYHYKGYLQFGRMHISRWSKFPFPNDEKFPTQNALVRKATELNPFSAEAYYFVGYLLEGERKLEDLQGGRSLENYAKALELNPNYLEALANTFRLSVLKGQFINSRQYYNRMLELSPGNPEAVFFMGMNFYHQFIFDSTIYYFNKNLAMKPNANAHMFLAATYENLGDTAKAVEHYTIRILNRENETDPIATSAYKRLRELDVAAWRQVNKKIPPVILED